MKTTEELINAEILPEYPDITVDVINQAIYRVRGQRNDLSYRLTQLEQLREDVENARPVGTRRQ